MKNLLLQDTNDDILKNVRTVWTTLDPTDFHVMDKTHGHLFVFSKNHFVQAKTLSFFYVCAYRFTIKSL